MTTPTDLLRMRAWLKEHAPPIPSRNDDVLLKFILCTLVSNAGYDNLGCRFALERPRLIPPGKIDGEGWEEVQASPDLKKMTTKDGYLWVNSLTKKYPQKSIKDVWIVALKATAGFSVGKTELAVNPFSGIKVRKDEDPLERESNLKPAGVQKRQVHWWVHWNVSV